MSPYMLELIGFFHTFYEAKTKLATLCTIPDEDGSFEILFKQGLGETTILYQQDELLVHYLNPGEPSNPSKNIDWKVTYKDGGILIEHRQLNLGPSENQISQSIQIQNGLIIKATEEKDTCVFNPMFYQSQAVVRSNNSLQEKEVELELSHLRDLIIHSSPHVLEAMTQYQTEKMAKAQCVQSFFEPMRTDVSSPSQTMSIKTTSKDVVDLMLQYTS